MVGAIAIVGMVREGELSPRLRDAGQKNSSIHMLSEHI